VTDDPFKELQLVVGAGVAADWPEVTSRIALADDNLVRVNVFSPRETMFTGIKSGRTTLMVWFASGRRAVYPVTVSPNLELINGSLREIHPSLLVSLGPDAQSVVLRGDVANETQARQARSALEQLLPVATGVATPSSPVGSNATAAVRIVNLVRYPGSIGTPEDRLMAAMSAIDGRIRIRRVQAGNEPSLEKDSYILEGRVRDINSLVQAVVLAERQLGGTGTLVRSADEARVTFDRGDNAGSASAGLGMTGSGSGGNGLRALQPLAPPKNGLAAQAARGLLFTSESGRVVSFLQIDALPQVLVSVRVLEIDRAKFRRLGLNASFNAKNLSGKDALSLRSSMIAGPVPDNALPPNPQSAAQSLVSASTALTALGNIAGGYVGATRSILAAVDFLGQQRIARSVSEPNILTLSGEIASVLVGGQVPIPTSVANQVAVQTSFNFQQFGVRMDIRPTVDDQGIIALEVVPSIVSPTTSLGNNNVPGFRIQRVETTARVKNGESLVLGGLISSSQSMEDRRVPGLGWLPLFRTSGTANENSELVFLITPRLMDQPVGDVLLPPLQFNQVPSMLGADGLDSKTGVPLSFVGDPALVIGKSNTCAEVRSNPAQDAQVVECVLVGADVVVREQQGSFLHVRTSTGTDGWIEGARVRRSAEKP